MTDSFPIYFLLLSLLFAILYGISAAGFRRVEKEGIWASGGIRTDSLKIASTIAFIGIFTSCSSAWVVLLYPAKHPALVGWSALSSQAALLAMWWHYERRGSGAVDVDILADHIESSLKKIILFNAGKLELIGDGTMSASEEADLYRISRESVAKEWELYPKALNRIIPSGPGKITESALETITQSVFFSRTRFNEIAMVLRKERKLKMLSPPPPLADVETK